MRVNGAQRAVMCVALGAVLIVIGLSLRAWWWPNGPGEGWFNYAPNNGVIFTEDGTDGGRIVAEAAMWVTLVLVWAASSLVLFKSGRASTSAGS